MSPCTNKEENEKSKHVGFNLKSATLRCLWGQDENKTTATGVAVLSEVHSFEAQ